MNPTTSTQQRTDGTWSATVNEDTCSHAHGNEAAAAGCANWEARAVAKGESRWHAPKAPRKQRLSFDGLRVPTSPDGELASDDDLSHSHEYVPMPDLIALWHAEVTGATKRPAGNLMFLGPSGSGKTDGAKALAALAGLAFTKVDAASMTDPEAWFGTREIVVQDGVAVTSYSPSAFIESIQKPGMTLIDEITRVRDEHRNVLLPLLDGTRAVTNPLTGEIVARHPGNFIVMAGNVGINFTGTNAIDPAFLTRARHVEFEYIDATNETRIVIEASGCDQETAEVFVRFAGETRMKAASDQEFTPISTRELIEAGRLVTDGLTRDLAVKFVVLNAASNEGGSSSLRQEMQNIWNGVRVVKSTRSEWVCPTHGGAKIIPAGVSSKTGRPYNAFKGCPTFGCQLTEDRSKVTITPQIVTCQECGDLQPAGRSTICISCGASLA